MGDAMDEIDKELLKAHLAEQDSAMRREILIDELKQPARNLGIAGVLLGCIVWYATGNFLSPFTMGLAGALFGAFIGGYEAIRLWWFWHHPEDFYRPNRPY